MIVSLNYDSSFIMDESESYYDTMLSIAQEDQKIVEAMMISDYNEIINGEPLYESVLDSVKDFIKKVFEAIKKAINGIKNFFLRMFGFDDDETKARKEKDRKARDEELEKEKKYWEQKQKEWEKKDKEWWDNYQKEYEDFQKRWNQYQKSSSQGDKEHEEYYQNKNKYENKYGSSSNKPFIDIEDNSRIEKISDSVKQLKITVDNDCANMKSKLGSSNFNKDDFNKYVNDSLKINDKIEDIKKEIADTDKYYEKPKMTNYTKSDAPRLEQIMKKFKTKILIKVNTMGEQANMMNDTFDTLVKNLESKSASAEDINILRKYVNTVGQGMIYILTAGGGIRGPINARWTQIKDTCKKVNGL